LSKEHCDHKPLSNQEIQQKIDQFGCFIICIESDNHLPEFAYTIGLYQKFNHPEIICFGLPQSLLFSVLNTACDLIKEGQSFQTGNHLYQDFIADYPVQFLHVNQSFYPDYWGTGCNFYGHRDFPAIQLVWPDKESIFPWEPGFNGKWKFKQPLLDRSMDFKFYEEKNVAVFTTGHVLEGKPIVYVVHTEDGEWEFHSEYDNGDEDIKLVSLESITKLDPGINQLYHLSPGQRAWRDSKEDAWEWE
jgi:hypothetical protein